MDARFRARRGTVAAVAPRHNVLAPRASAHSPCGTPIRPRVLPPSAPSWSNISFFRYSCRRPSHGLFQLTHLLERGQNTFNTSPITPSNLGHWKYPQPRRRWLAYFRGEVG